MPKRLVVLLLAGMSVAVIAAGSAALASVQAQKPVATQTAIQLAAQPTPVVLAEKQKERAARLIQKRMAKLRRRIVREHKLADYWAWEMQKDYPKPVAYIAFAADTQVLKPVAAHWHKTRLRLEHEAKNPPHLSDWLCIHSHEGAWDDDTGNGYYGGLQMDWTFMSKYGPKLLATEGKANNWTPLEQIWTAERAYESGRGFYPWPNTARMCGLI